MLNNWTKMKHRTMVKNHFSPYSYIIIRWMFSALPFQRVLDCVSISVDSTAGTVYATVSIIFSTRCSSQLLLLSHLISFAFNKNEIISSHPAHLIVLLIKCQTLQIELNGTFIWILSLAFPYESKIKTDFSY